MINLVGGDYELIRVRWYHRLLWRLTRREEPEGVPIAKVTMTVHAVAGGGVRAVFDQCHN